MQKCATISSVLSLSFRNFDTMPFDKFRQLLLRHPVLPLPTSELMATTSQRFPVQWKPPIEDQCPRTTEEPQYTRRHVSLFRFQCLAFLSLKFVSTEDAMHTILAVELLAYYVNTLVFTPAPRGQYTIHSSVDITEDINASRTQ
jgi:hypothetical protein